MEAAFKLMVALRALVEAAGWWVEGVCPPIVGGTVPMLPGGSLSHVPIALRLFKDALILHTEPSSQTVERPTMPSAPALLRCRSLPRSALAFAFWLALALPLTALAQATYVQTPYQNPRVLFDFYLDHPAKMGSALYWLRSFMNPLVEAPYSFFKEDMNVIVLLHGTELVTVAKKNESKYEEVVQRMRYYAQQGVTFKVCGLALKDYGYTLADMQPFIEVTPSAVTELVHWQNQGYALITPNVTDKILSIEEIR